MPQHPKNLGTYASAVARDFGPALGFFYKLSVALTAMIKGQGFPPSPSFICKIVQAYFGERLYLLSQCPTRHAIQILRAEPQLLQEKTDLFYRLQSLCSCVIKPTITKSTKFVAQGYFQEHQTFQTHTSFRKSQKHDADTLTIAYTHKKPPCWVYVKILTIYNRLCYFI